MPARAFLLAAQVAVLAAPASAQGLGDAAAQERSRRADEKKPESKVFTNDDLSSGAESASDGEEEAEDASGATPSPDDRETDEEWRARTDKERAERVLQEREWRARFAEARARVREEEARCWQDVVRTEFYQGIPVQMKVKEFVESEAFRQAKQALADLQEEFRRTGLPPGWARE